MLSPYRVLDLTDERGHLAGMILASFGAEVIKVEPPQGVRTRRSGPFSDRGTSLTHAAYDRGKRSVVLDLESTQGCEQLLSLAGGADVIIESLGAGVLDALGIGPESLAAAHPALVVGTLTAYGHQGPKALWPATDLTVMASGCTMAFTGDADRSPVRVSVPQAFHLGAAVLAGGVISALFERGRSGLGQVVDVAAQQVVPIATQGGVLSAACNFPTPIRTSGGLSVGPIDLRLVYPALDGFVSITHVFGGAIGPLTGRLMDWCVEEGHTTAEIAGLDWVNFAALLESGEVSIDTWEAAKAAVAALTSSKTKAELLSAAMERRLLIAPINDVAEVLESSQLAARGYLTPLMIDGRQYRAPGPFARCSEVPLTPLTELAGLGEHTDEVLGTPRRPFIGATTATRTTSTTTTKKTDQGPRERPLDGVKVIDFTWSLAGPFTTRMLADLGATVVKIESIHKPDAGRGFLPIWDNVPGLEQSALFDSANAGKLSLALDMRTAQAHEVIRDLVRWADLLCESYSPRAMRGWGLHYDALKEINPALVMLSTCLMGQDGPLASFAGYGNLGAAMSGFYGLAGWPDRPPSGPFGAYTDYTSTHLMAATVLAALDHQRRTGDGQHIDMSQAEAAIHFIAPALLDAEVTGNVAVRAGNADPDMAPHGGYRCVGDDEWVAIAVINDAAWQRLCVVIGRDDLAAESGLATVAGRLVAHERIDQAVEKWTLTYSATSATELLIGAGIAAHAVQSSAECLADPQLALREHFVWLEHPDRGCVVENGRFQLSRSESGPRQRAPFLGEHTFDVLTEFLGYDPDHIADLAATEVLE